MPNNVRAIMMMIAGMFFFTLGDLFLKLATTVMPLGMVMIALGLGMSVLFMAMMARARIPLYQKSYFHHALIMRSVGEMIGVVGMFIALAYAPLSSVTAIMQSLPLVLTAMGALFLKEPVGVRRLSALIAGFIGVLIIIRPGMSGFDIFASFTLIGVLGMAIRDFGTRILPSDISTLAVSFYGAVVITLTGFVIMMITNDWHMPDRNGLYLSLALVIMASIGTIIVTNAIRLADMALVSPFRFSRVVFGVGAGILFLGESVDKMTLLGSAIVVGAGLYSWMREVTLAKAS